jgi:transposase-like protein
MAMYSEEEKKMWVEDWKESGQSAWAYAKKNNLCPQTFRNWTKEGPGQKFVEVKPKKTVQRETGRTVPGSEILVEKGEVRIHIPFRNDGSSFKTILEYLAGRP